MMKMLKVLIPTDFSEVSFLALQMAELLSKKIPVQVHMVHVIEANTSSADYAETDVEQKGLQAKEEKALIHFNSLKAAGQSFESHIKVGLLTDQINASAQELGADLIIMGTHGSAGFMERISGSEAQHVARYQKVPVITIRPGTATMELKNILLVADFERFGKGFRVDTIKAIAEAFDSTIHLLQIVQEDEEKYADQIEAKMRSFAAEHQLTKYEAHLYRDRKVAEGVRNFNREAEMDLVCIPTHGRKGINHFLFGSIAERLVNHCIKPLLTFQLKENA
ncbi:MAG TPA: universal stress protein [Sphingobacteriaceae bacterium]